MIVERLKELNQKKFPTSAEIEEVYYDLDKILGAIEAAQATSPFCEEPAVTAIGLVPCDVCSECILRLRIAALCEPTL